MEFTIFPIPAYSATDPESGLSSTRWLLSQSDDFQKMNIPLPYEVTPPSPTPLPFGDSEVTSAPLHPLFPTPAAFGDPLEVGGWKDRKPRWVVAIPQVVTLNGTTPVCILSCLRLFHFTDTSTAVQELRPSSYDEQ